MQKCADNHVIDPASLLVDRRARRAKSDRNDAVGLARIMGFHFIECSARAASSCALESASPPGMSFK